jgi:hypothetical protein
MIKRLVFAIATGGHSMLSSSSCAAGAGAQQPAAAAATAAAVGAAEMKHVEAPHKGLRVSELHY